MAGASDDDVQDGDTTAAGVAPATSSADEEDRTVQQPPDPKIRSAIAKELNQPAPARAAPPRAAVAVPSASKPGVSLPTNVTSKRMTVVGLAPPAAGSAAAPPTTARSPTSISPLATTMDKKVGPTSTNPTSGPASSPRPGVATKPGAAPLSTTKAGPAASTTKPGKPENEADEEDASITATAPAPRVGPAAAASAGVVVKAPPPLPLTVPGQVQIREMPPPEEEPLDETEVRTVVSGPPPDNAPAVPAQKLEAKAAAEEEEEEELEDSVTTQAPSAVVGGRLPEEEQDEPKTSPPLRMPPPIPAAGRSPFDEPPIRSAAATQAKAEEDDDDAYNVEDSVTTRGPAIPDFRLDDSVTADSPVVDHPPESSGRWPSPVGARVATMSQALGIPPKNAAGLPPAIEDGTEGTTNRFAGQQGPHTSPSPGAAAANKKAPPRPAATLASPAALNLPPKVGAAADEDEDDLHEDNRTAVMLGAPVKPNGPSGSARAARPQMAGGMTHLSAGVARAQAPADKASSESGLRVAPHEQHQPPPPPPTDERASLGAMMAGALHANHANQASQDRGSGVAPREYPSQPLPLLQPHQVQHHYPASEPNLALGATIPATSPLMAQQMGTALPMSQMPQMQQYDFASTIKKPRYGLLVGLVALLSFAIPLVLFLWLHQNAQEPYIRAPAEVASDKQGLAPPQGKSLAPSPSGSAAKKTSGKK